MSPPFCCKGRRSACLQSAVSSPSPLTRSAAFHHPSFAQPPRVPRDHSGFTLIELLATVTVISVLAALALGTLGYANRKGAESKARVEMAALATAIDSYKLDTGTYPSNASSLYVSLCSTATNAKVYFEPRPQMLTTNEDVVLFVDPWGDPYGYTNSTNFFELWSTAGEADTNKWIRN